jgi:hypothetical protein
MYTVNFRDRLLSDGGGANRTHSDLNGAFSY